LLDGTNNWLAVGGPLADAAGGGGAAGAAGRAWIGWRMVAAEDWGVPAAGPPEAGLPAAVAPPPALAVRTVADASPEACGAVGRARVPSAPEVRPSPPEEPGDTAEESDSSVAFADAPRCAEPVPARDTWSG